MKIITVDELTTLDGNPTKEILLLRETRPSHWLREHGYRLLSNSNHTGLPSELWHDIASFLEDGRDSYTWYTCVVQVTPVEGRTATSTVAVEEVLLPIQDLSHAELHAVSRYDQALSQYTLMGAYQLVFLESPRVWELSLLGQDANLHQLYNEINSTDVTYFIHKGHCHMCMDTRGACQRILNYDPFEYGGGCHPHIACPNCMGFEATDEDIDFMFRYKTGETTLKDAEDRAKGLNEMLKEMGYEAKEWKDFDWEKFDAHCETPCGLRKQCPSCSERNSKMLDEYVAAHGIGIGSLTDEELFSMY